LVKPSFGRTVPGRKDEDKQGIPPKDRRGFPEDVSRDRSFSKGVMNLYLQNGFVIFKELEISNRNLLGMNDLSVKVAPFNNRIGIDHLMWTITEAAQRRRARNNKKGG